MMKTTENSTHLLRFLRNRVQQPEILIFSCKNSLKKTNNNNLK